MRNPNMPLLFTYGNTTTTLYYHGIVVGEARRQAGRAEPRRTARMNVVVDVSTDRLLPECERGCEVEAIDDVQLFEDSGRAS
ncbi:hypothetical protein FH972_003865 [Carpinus fangiana]|uniref:Late embryogenesis abundant protein LEA-2 subgroup domain-containing protein n=1 Tax=Carpinus fangiana TaxID=176857 RepID=A0A5N6QJB9_9ROSI|nr:hypothetical protein FH972_003865 [Carpinus fangiana]